MRPSALKHLAFAAALLSAPPLALAQQPHNVILFVPDGLRALMVTPENAPVMAEIRDKGINFKNPHSLFPTFTTANASAMATGHYLGDTGDFSNTIYTGFPVPGAGGSLTPFLESDPVLGDVDEHFSGDYLDEVTLLKAARESGLQHRDDRQARAGADLRSYRADRKADDRVRRFDRLRQGHPAVRRGARRRLQAAELPLKTPSRGANGNPGKFDKPGTTVANVEQQDYFAAVATKVVLPMFKARGKPFVLVFWSRDPDGSQHNQGDSLNQLTPGINGPTSLAAIKNADTDLGRIRQALADLGLADTTDIVVSADHGFSTISKESKTSAAAKASYADVPPGFLPPGFLALDIAKALDLPLLDPDAKNAPVAPGTYPKFGQRADRPRSRQAAGRRRGEWRVGPRLFPGQGQGAGGAHRHRAARPGLRQRAVRRRRARPFPGYAAAERDQPAGRGGDADAGDCGQFPLLGRRLHRDS